MGEITMEEIYAMLQEILFLLRQLEGREDEARMAVVRGER